MDLLSYIAHTSIICPRGFRFVVFWSKELGECSAAKYCSLGATYVSSPPQPPIPWSIYLRKKSILLNLVNHWYPIGPLQDPVTWYGINYTGTQITQWDFQNKGTRTSPARLCFVLKVPLRNLRPSVIYSVPCDRILQRAYWQIKGNCNVPLEVIPNTALLFLSDLAYLMWQVQSCHFQPSIGKCVPFSLSFFSTTEMQYGCKLLWHQLPLQWEWSTNCFSSWKYPSCILNSLTIIWFCRFFKLSFRYSS